MVQMWQRPGRPSDQGHWTVGHGDPRKTRTSGLRFRKPPLYPAELWGHASSFCRIFGRNARECAAIARRIETYLPAAQWLVERGCDCRPELMAYETTARAYPDSPERRAFLERVAQTRGAYREAPLAKRSLPEDGDADPL